MDHALFNALVIAYHALHAVRLDAVQVGGQQYVLNDIGLRFRKAEPLKGIHAECVERIIVPMLISHEKYPF